MIYLLKNGDFPWLTVSHNQAGYVLRFILSIQHWLILLGETSPDDFGFKQGQVAREMNEPKQAKFSQCPGESLKLNVNSMYSTSTVRLPH